MKPPPHNPEAEAAILGAILLRGREALAEAEGLLSIADFWRPQHQAVFRAARILGERGDDIDAVTVEAQLRRTGEIELVGGLEAIVKLDRHATPGSLASHARLVRERSRERQAIAIGRRMAEDLAAGNVEDLTAYLGRAIADLQHVEKDAGGKVPPWALFDVAKRMLHQRMLESVGGVVSVSTGIPEIDRRLKGGGMRPGQLIIIGGRPKMGKSTLASSIARACFARPVPGWPRRYRLADKPIPVLHACDEMTATETAERFVCDLGSVDSMQLGSASPEWLTSHGPQFSRALGVMQGSRFEFVPDDATHYLHKIFAMARDWRACHEITGRDESGKPIREPAVLILDYLQRFDDLPTSSRHASKTERVGDKVRACKTLAQELGIVVVLLSQLNRDVEGRENKRPTPADFRDSGEIEQEADVLMSCYRDIVYAKPEERAQVDTQIEELSQRSDLSSVDLDLVLAHHSEDWQFADSDARRLRSECRLTDQALDMLLSAMRRQTEAEINIMAGRAAIPGTAVVDFVGKHYRFQPRGDLT